MPENLYRKGLQSFLHHQEAHSDSFRSVVQKTLAELKNLVQKAFRLHPYVNIAPNHVLIQH